MKKIIALIVLMLLIVGCDGQQTDDKTSTGGSGVAFIGGDKGLDIKFNTGAPPEEVYDVNYPFNINVRLENVGETDIPGNEAIVRIKGIFPQDYNVIATDLVKKNVNELRGASLDPQGNPLVGSIDGVEFVNLQANTITGTIYPTILAEVCYPYATKAVAQICILEDLLGSTRKTGETALCEVNDDKETQNSGAPVKVTNVKQSAIGKDKISLSFDVEHVGEGALYKRGVACEPTLQNKNRVTIKVDSNIVGGQMICTGLQGTEGSIELYGNSGNEKRNIVCTQTLPTRIDSEKQIKIDLEYAYEDKVQTKIAVRHTE